MSSIDRYAVIGEHIGHSKSPQIHELFAAATREPMQYGLIDVGIAGFAGAVREFFKEGGRGLNVTVPHKHAALQLADTLTPRARRAGAVNTLARGLAGSADSCSWAITRTVPGWCGTSRPICASRCAAPGSCCSARAVRRAESSPRCSKAVPHLLRISNRDAAKAQELAQEFADLGPVHAAPLSESGGTPCDLIVNATSASLRGELPSIPAGAVGPQILVLRLRLRRARHGLYELGPECRGGPGRDGIWGCWSNRPPSPSCCGAACVRTRLRYLRRCELDRRIDRLLAVPWWCWGVADTKMRPVMTLLSAAIVLFLVMDPLGNILLFVTALRSVPAARRKRVVIRELLIAYAVLVMFLFTGEHLLHALNISGPALTIAGGIVLFLIALRMVFPSTENTLAENIKGEPFLVPLAIPYVAGPSTLATLLLLMSREPERWPEWLLALSCAWLISAIILVLGGYIGDFLGRRGLLAIERLMGLLLVALAVQMSIEGLRVALKAS